MCPQSLETELPGRVDRPFVVVRLLFIMTVFVQKFTTTFLVQFKIEANVTLRHEDIGGSVDHGQRKVSEFLIKSQSVDLLAKDNKSTFTISVASASISLVLSMRAISRNRFLASSGLMSETWQYSREREHIWRFRLVIKIFP